MTFLALAGKCGFLGVSRSSLASAGWVANRFSFKRAVRAMVPRPVLQTLKNWRWVRYLRISSRRFMSSVMLFGVLFFCDHLCAWKVEHHYTQFTAFA